MRFWALTFSLFGWAFGYLWAVKNQPLTACNQTKAPLSLFTFFSIDKVASMHHHHEQQRNNQSNRSSWRGKFSNLFDDTKASEGESLIYVQW